MKTGKGIDLGKLIAEAGDLYDDIQEHNQRGKSFEFTVEQDIEILVGYPSGVKSKFVDLFRKRHNCGSRDLIAKRAKYLIALVPDVKKYDPDKVKRYTPRDY